MITIITRITLIVMKIRIAMIKITVSLWLLVIITGVIITIIITLILIIMIIRVILKIRIMLLVLLLIIIILIVMRIIIWINPPFSKNLATKIGRYFLNLIDKHFPRDQKFYQIFNRNTINFSCSCMPNIKSAINSHNRKILYSPVNNQSRTCYCINKTDRPLQEKCLSDNTLYQADISSENFQTKIYCGISETKFKTKYSNHQKSFNHGKHKNHTQLSNELWKIKSSKEEPVLVWKSLGQYQSFSVNTKRYLLCLN